MFRSVLLWEAVGCPKRPLLKIDLSLFRPYRIDISSAYQESCLKPCTDVEYSVAVSEHLTDLALLPYMTGCPVGQTFAEIVFRRKIEIETVREYLEIRKLV